MSTLWLEISKQTTSYVNVPVVMETQNRAENIRHCRWLCAGVIGSRDLILGNGIMKWTSEKN